MTSGVADPAQLKLPSTEIALRLMVYPVAAGNPPT